MNAGRHALFVGLALASVTRAEAPVEPPASAEWRRADASYAWEFPRDHWAHAGYKSEWWYLTGALTGPSGERFGYQFTFFRIGLSPSPPAQESQWASQDLIMGHLAITDVTRDNHVFSETLTRVMPLLGGFGTAPEELLAWSVGPPGTASRWELRWNGNGFRIAASDSALGLALELDLRAVKPLVLQGPHGLSIKANDGTASLYYSFTRLETTGTLRVGEAPVPVRGQSWMDKEFSTSQLTPEQVGWDWAGIRLDDGRELMLFLMRRKDGGIDVGHGTLVDAGGATRYLGAAEFSLEGLATWRSDATRSTYPSGWRLRVPSADLDVEIRPLVLDQENIARRARLHYWEGVVDVIHLGLPIGNGYVELTGYGEDNRPPL